MSRTVLSAMRVYLPYPLALPSPLSKAIWMNSESDPIIFMFTVVPCWCQIPYQFHSVLRIRDVYPGFWLLPIPDPGSKNSNKRERWKKISCYTFFCSSKFHKIENYFIFEKLKKKMWANFQRFIELFTQILSPSSQIYWFGMRDPRSGKNLLRIQGSKRHRIPNPELWIHYTCISILRLD